MIKTGLPYSTENMSEIYSNGAEVDMSNIDFPTNQDKYRTTFIYLRNTNFNNINLDFSKCSYEEKERFLLEYIKSDITVELFPLIYTWQCLLTYKSCKPYFSDDEAKKFLKNNSFFIEEMKSFYLSLPIYLFSRLKLVDLDFKDIEKIELFEGGRNCYFLIQNEFISYLNAINSDFDKPKFYTKHFTEDNNVLFEFIQGLDIYSLIQTMTESSEEDFKKILKGLEDFENQRK